ncbi:MAG: hypothetical protein QXU32_02330 [Nitrososphaerales archaeon]
MSPIVPIRRDPPVSNDKCGICGNPKVKLEVSTERRRYPVMVCNTGKPGARMPCDGYVFSISLKNKE